MIIQNMMAAKRAPTIALPTPMPAAVPGAIESLGGGLGVEVGDDEVEVNKFEFEAACRLLESIFGR